MVLDHWREVYEPSHWPVTLADRDPEVLARRTQYDGSNPTLVSTAEFGARRIRDHDLLNVRSGRVERGADYLLTRLSLALLAAVALSCAPSPEPRLLRRYAGYELADAPGLVDVAVFATPLEPLPAGAPSVGNLSASAQSELIRAVAARTTDLPSFLGALSFGGTEGAGPGDAGTAGAIPGAGVPGATGPAGSPPVFDRTRFRRKLVVSVESRATGAIQGRERGDASRTGRDASGTRPEAPPSGPDAGGWRLGAGARVTRVRLALGLDTAVARFTAWNRFESRHERVELGEARLVQGREEGLDLDRLVPSGPVGGDLSVTAGRTATLDEQLRLSERYLSTGMLRSDSLVLLQVGTVGTDLVGNSVLEVELDLVDAPAGVLTLPGALFEEDGTPRSPGAVRLREATLLRPGALPDGLRATVGFEAVTRTVPPGRGDDTFSEGDDHVLFLRTVEAGRPLLLVPARELRVSVWEIVDADCRGVLHLRRSPALPARVLHFPDPATADRFLRWLRATGADRVEEGALTLGPDRPVVPATADSLRVRLLPLNWDAGDLAACR